MKVEGTGVYLGIVLLIAAIFFVEVRMPLGFTPWLLYVVPLGLTFWASFLYAPLIVATGCTILIVGGYFYSPVGVSAPIALINRTFGLVIFWVLGLLILQYKILAKQLSDLTKTLSSELAERTRDLGLAVSALQTEVELRQRSDRDPSGSRTELERQVTNVLKAEEQRLQETVATYGRTGPSGYDGEEALEKTRQDLVQLGHRLERLQRELLQDEQGGV